MNTFFNGPMARTKSSTPRTDSKSTQHRPDRYTFPTGNIFDRRSQSCTSHCRWCHNNFSSTDTTLSWNCRVQQLPAKAKSIINQNKSEASLKMILPFQRCNPPWPPSLHTDWSCRCPSMPLPSGTSKMQVGLWKKIVNKKKTFISSKRMIHCNATPTHTSSSEMILYSKS
jgi:hypothetical protein